MYYRKTNTMIIFGITYLIVGCYVVYSTSDFSVIMLKKLIFSISMATLFFSLADIFSFLTFAKKSLNIANINFNKKTDIIFLLENMLSIKQEVIKSSSVILNLAKFLFILGFSSSIFTIFIDCDVDEKILSLIVIVSFSLYILKIGMEESLYYMIEKTYLLKRKLDDTVQQEKQFIELYKRINSYEDLKNVHQPHRKTVRRRYRTRPHPRRLP